MRYFKRGMILGVIAACFLTAAVYGAAGNEITFKNIFNTGSVDVKIRQLEVTPDGEQLIGPDVAMPDQNISYIPEIINTRADSYVRVGVQIGMDKETEIPLTLEHIYGLSDGWIQRGEYFYYTEPMGFMEKARLFSGIKIPAEWDRETASGFNIKVTVDGVQAAGFSPDFDTAMPWGSVMIQSSKEHDDTVYRQAGVSATDKEPSSLAPSGYANILKIDRGLLLESNTQDLFRNFSYFMAGDTYKDSLKIVNDSGGDVKVSFRTETAYGHLNEKARLEISCDGKSLYSGDLMTEPLREYRALTELGAGETGVLEFKVTVPEDADNFYSVLEDQVIWKIRVEPVSGGSGAVQTGDDMSLGVWLMMAAAALAVAAGVAFRGRLRRWKK